jgi:hypothetical protein
MFKGISMLFGLLAAIFLLPSSSAHADDKTRWVVFNPDQEFVGCNAAQSNVARSYCYDEIDKKLRRAIKWADGYVVKLLSEKAKKPDDYNQYEGKYGLEAMKMLRGTADTYGRLIPNDCKIASWSFRGGSGEGLLAQTCEIELRTRLFNRYKLFFD